jgi:hypothetical protein
METVVAQNPYSITPDPLLSNICNTITITLYYQNRYCVTPQVFPRQHGDGGGKGLPGLPHRAFGESEEGRGSKHSTVIVTPVVM